MSVPRYFTLNNGEKIPSIGFGTFAAPANVVGDAVCHAIEIGFRHIDCAMLYENEKEIGAAIAKSMKLRGLDRGDIFVTSKLWCDKHSPNDVRDSCELSLKHLGLKYLDLYLIHLPTAFHTKPGKKFDGYDRNAIVYENQSLEETWKAMEGLVAAGLVKSIGVSNFNGKQVDRILAVCSIKPVVNQIEVSVNCMNRKLIEHCQSKNIQVEAYAPIGSPGVMGGKIPSLLEEPFVKKIATAHKKTPAQVLLRHALQRNLVVLCKSVTPSRIESNFDIFDFELTDAEMQILNTSGHNVRLFDVPALKDHPEYPYNEDC
uniref:Aldo_ket_red domain-containing protein n=2 Tax=Mesocestoides corti TaxID=53468 RepID=A0A5K3FYE3_MESCO